MKQVAIYARVSGDRQAREATVESQLAALRERVQADGHVLTESDLYVDEGVTGAILVRPALERLRDRAAEGKLDRLYVLCPDRLARAFPYQVVLLDEFSRAGVEVIFLNREIGDSPEDALLVQVQGVIAEYERAKILERSRRGKIYRVRSGEVSPLSGAPYGYRYVTKRDAGRARYEVAEDEARVVQRIFREYVGEGRAIGEITRRLTADGITTRTGKNFWDRSVVWNMLKNPAYMGLAAFGKTHVRERTRPVGPGRRRPTVPRHSKSCHDDVPQDRWVRVPVPAIVPEELFQRAQQQLKENRRFALRNTQPGRHLLRGLVVCAQCRYGCYAKPVSRSTAKRKKKWHVYYRCTGSDAYRFGGQRVCWNPQVRADDLERAVWESVEEYLRDPRRVVEEFRRRQETPTQETSVLEAQREAAMRAAEKSQRALRRLVEAYEAGVFTLEEVQERIGAAREKVRQNEDHLKKMEETLVKRREWQEVITQVSDFTSRLESGLGSLDEAQRQKLVRLIVDRVELGKNEITIVHRVPFGKSRPPADDPNSGTDGEKARAVG
jgi:site-specific DNA recombinase